jgi:LCP family protein required for cell wall assembly
MTNGLGDGEPASRRHWFPSHLLARLTGDRGSDPAEQEFWERPGWRPRPSAPSATPRTRKSAATIALRSLAVLMAAVVTGGLLTAYLVFRSDWNAIHRVDVSKDLKNLTASVPPDPNALNILLIGSDSRAGVNNHFGAQVQGQRSDTVMVVHISPGDGHVVVLSIPRDSVVPILNCTPEPGAPGQTAQPGQVEQINATFAYGGPGCLWETIEQTTGIPLNDFIELTFTGFERLIDDIGGVNVCLPVAINDPDSRLRLSAGRHHVWGAEALAFWRARYIGEGSDLQRIQRDQYLMASLLQGIEHSGLLRSPSEIFRVLRDVAGQGDITTDTQLTVGRLFTIAQELRGLPPGAVQFIEVPSVPYPGNPAAWVQWAQPQANDLFDAIASNTTVPKTQPVSTGGNGQGAPVLDTVSPGQVNVNVLNGTTTPGLATSTATSLTDRGFNVVGPPADAASSDYVSSVIEYASSADLAAAHTLAGQFSHVTLQLDPSLAPGTLTLILGANFTGLKAASPSAPGPSTSASPSSTPSSSAGSQDLGQYGGITGSVGICTDSAAFAGPDGTN